MKSSLSPAQVAEVLILGRVVDKSVHDGGTADQRKETQSILFKSISEKKTNV